MIARIARLMLLLFTAAALHTAFAQSDPTIDQVYKAAQAGQLIQAQEMMKQVLRDHPKSGKAHFVEAELLARQGLFPKAREELALAESLAPGLPFAKPAAVQALRAELAPATPGASRMGAGPAAEQMAPAPAAGFSFPWGAALGFGAAAAVLYVMLQRRRAAAVSPMGPAGYTGGMGVPAQPMGMGPGGASMGQPGAAYGPGGAPYGAQPYGTPYGAAPQPGMGSRIAGGLATGLAVGAGVVAAEEIGRRMMGSSDHRPAAAPVTSQDSFTSLDQNADMGGNDFGLNDAGSWDDGGGSGDVGGGGWDN